MPCARRRISSRFNEAACNTGGTPWFNFQVNPGIRMRFNEAACNTGGTPPRPGSGPPGPPRGFNEAACNTGGTLGPRHPPPRAELASMRPPAIQAERAAAPAPEPTPTPLLQ